MIKYIDMQHLKIIFVIATIVTLGALTYSTYNLNEKITAQENAIKEIAGVLTAGGMVVPDKDGKAMVNPLLLEAWKQANQ